MRQYTRLSEAKFAVLHRIEERLPVSLYGAEWEHLTRNWPFPYGRHPRWDLLMPRLFIALHVLLMTVVLL